MLSHPSQCHEQPTEVKRTHLDEPCVRLRKTGSIRSPSRKPESEQRKSCPAASEGLYDRWRCRGRLASRAPRGTACPHRGQRQAGPATAESPTFAEARVSAVSQSPLWETSPCQGAVRCHHRHVGTAPERRTPRSVARRSPLGGPALPSPPALGGTR